ncbi:MAG: C69 family dipeptidase [Acidobacteria bacterium]|nr:C69 family dipeptidase [Acidobacteriota bacterium]
MALFGCDSWVALGDATADGSVILAKNSDRPPMEAQPLVQTERLRHAAGERVRCTYIEIPQAAETYAHIGSKIWWAFGYEHGLNEFGVAIGNEAVWSKAELQWGGGLLGMDLVRLGLERAKTAHAAMLVIIGLLEKYGQCGDCEREGEWGKANYHNSFLLADRKEAWVLETAGRYWVARRIRQGVYSISNIYSIEQEWDEASPDLVEHALKMGWSGSAGEFNFARDYGDYWRSGARNPGAMQIRRNTTLNCLRRDFGKVTPARMMAISRSHMEDTVLGPRWSAAEPFWPTPCLHDSPADGYHTAASMVAHIRGEEDPMLGQVYWAGFSNPCTGVYQPFYLDGGRVPVSYGGGTSRFSEDSPWWLANRIKILCSLNYQALGPVVRSVFDPVESSILERQPEVEAEARKQIAAGKRRQAAAVLEDFVSANRRRIGEHLTLLNAELPALLEKSGIRYLFSQYLKEWAAKSEVPLPPL